MLTDDYAADIDLDDDDLPELEETEADLSPADWWYVGHVDGYHGRPAMPPQDPDLAAEYADGVATGKRERVEDDERKANAPAVDPAEYADIPF